MRRTRISKPAPRNSRASSRPYFNKARDYEALGISADARYASVRCAYLELAKRWHPDRNKSRLATERFAAIGTAYRNLTSAISVPDRSILMGPEQPVGCSVCGSGEAGLRTVNLTTVTSFLLTVQCDEYRAIYCPSCAWSKSLQATARSAIFGWWSPLGPICVMRAIGRNAKSLVREGFLNLTLSLHNPIFEQKDTESGGRASTYLSKSVIFYFALLLHGTLTLVILALLLKVILLLVG
ncbi:MAG: J domain-containing protein [Sphingomonadaceae bacterium]|nr:J domain-containing protein [Sphingomonadaceae bacterium]